MIRHRPDRRFDIVPPSLVVERAANQRRDERAAPPRSYPPVELRDDRVLNIYVHSHTHSLAHRLDPPLGQSMRRHRIRDRPSTGRSRNVQATDFQRADFGDSFVVAIDVHDTKTMMQRRLGDQQIGDGCAVPHSLMVS